MQRAEHLRRRARPRRRRRPDHRRRARRERPARLARLLPDQRPGRARRAGAARASCPSRAPSGARRSTSSGAITLAVGLTAILLPLIEGRQLGWPVWTWISLAAAPAILALFVRRQARLERPAARPGAVPRPRRSRAGLVTQLFLACAQASFFVYLALYLQVGRGLERARRRASCSRSSPSPTSRCRRRRPALAQRFGRVGGRGRRRQPDARPRRCWRRSVGRRRSPRSCPACCWSAPGIGLCFTPLTSIVLAERRPGARGQPRPARCRRRSRSASRSAWRSPASIYFGAAADEAFDAEPDPARRRGGRHRPRLAAAAARRPSRRSATVVQRDSGSDRRSLLREWRTRRRLSQLDLALEADVSTRHLSFVETGRSQPSREMVLHLAEQLDVPLRERNRLLLAAGYAPAYPDSGTEERRRCGPRSPAARGPRAVSRRSSSTAHWKMVAANAGVALLLEGVGADLLEPPVNALRLALHPEGMAPKILNLGEWRAHLLARPEAAGRGHARSAAARAARRARGVPGRRGRAPAPARDLRAAADRTTTASCGS